MPLAEDVPWWWHRCTHSYGVCKPSCWDIYQEAEGVVVLGAKCYLMDQNIHICVEKPGVGSMCKSLSLEQYRELTNEGLLKIVQSQWRELKSL